jgi:hypothetical protein
MRQNADRKPLVDVSNPMGTEAIGCIEHRAAIVSDAGGQALPRLPHDVRLRSAPSSRPLAGDLQ